MSEPEIKTIRIEDILKGSLSKLNFSHLQVRYDDSFAKSAEYAPSDVRGGSASSPVDDLKAALYEAYLKGSWCHKQYTKTAPSALPAPLYTAMLRVLLLPWNEPPQAIATSFPMRLQRTELIAQKIGVPPLLHKQAMVRAVEANNQLVTELQLQMAAIKDGSLPGMQGQDAALSQEAYSAWRTGAMKETEALLQRQTRLPEYNGLLQLTVLGAEGLVLNEQKGLFSKPAMVNPYVLIRLDDAMGRRLGQPHTSSVKPGTTDPRWDLALDPLILNSDACDLSCQVKHCADGKSPSHRTSRGKVLGMTGFKTGGLPLGIPLRVELELYGRGAKPKGLCACFGGPAVEEEEVEDEEGPQSGPSRANRVASTRGGLAGK